MSLQPFLHEHYLLFDKYEKEEACCDKCNVKIDGWAFTCEICKFWLHKSCAVQHLPRQISRPLHPQHLLTLVYHDAFDSPLFFCNACFCLTRNCFYQCSACNFRIDLVCASSSSSPPPSITNQFKLIDHFCHNHKLTRFKYRKVSKDHFCCFWCEKLLFSSGISYGCFKCDLKESLFHEMCLTRMPTRITEHAFHPSRPLYVTPFSLSYECFACGYEFHSEHDKSMYSCRGWRHAYGCRFKYLHIRCANRKPSLKHDQLHEHPLTLFPIIRSLNLKGPCMKCKEMIHPDRVFTNYYRCVECGFNYHIRCLIPIRVKNFEYHRHERLKCTDFFVEDYSEQYYCDVCEKERVPLHPVYHCKECTFVAHIGCILNKVKLKIKEDHAKFDSGSSSFMAGAEKFWGELKVGTENLFREAIVDLRDEGERYFGYRKEDQSGVEHFDHEHPLYHEVTKQKEYPVCKACWVEISGDAYGCENCDYYLHKTCIDLLFEVPQHPLHPQHSLWLMPGTRTAGFVSNVVSRYYRKSHRFEPGSYVCDGCRNHTCGYFYTCIVCDFKLDVKCATPWEPEMSSSKSDTQRQKENIREMTMRQSKLCPFNKDHNLDLSNVVFKTLDVCSLCEQHLEGLTYRCSDCKYAIHESCLGFPREMQLEFHPQHRLHPHPGCGKVCSACKSGLSDTISDYICYSCDDLHLHPYCAKSLKRVLKPKSHYVDHNLCYFGPNTDRGYTLMPFMGRMCIRCFGWIQTPFCFCMDCEAKWHPECVLPSSLKSKYHIHPLTLSTGFMEDDSGEYYCDICEQERDPTDHVYCCMGCNIGIFIAHLSCALNSIKDDGNGSSSSGLADQPTVIEKFVSWEKKPRQYISSTFKEFISKFSEIENVLLPTSSSSKKILRQQMRHLLL